MSIVTAAVAALLTHASMPAADIDAATTTAAQGAPAPAAAPAAPPPFKLVNHDEDYAYLADASKRTSDWAKLKYVPIGGEDSGIWASFGGELRLRAEHRNNERFGRGAQDKDGNFQTRARLWGELNLGQNFRAFVDIQDARNSGLDSGEPVVEESRTDFHQGFVEARTELAGTKLAARVGRQEFGVGSFRLFDMREGANARVALDMVRVLYDAPNGWSGNVFAGYGIWELKTSFDDSTDYEHRILGATAARTLGTGPSAPKMELLYVNTDRRGAVFDRMVRGRDDRHTFSVRLAGKVAPFDYEIEGVKQYGDFDALDIDAWFVTGVVGRTFADVKWSPRVAVRIDAASGDDNPNDGKLNTFNPLFPQPAALRTDLGFGNMVLIQPEVTARPNPKLTVGANTGGMWRQSKQDGVYALSGMVLRSATEGDSRYIGWRTGVFARYAINPFVSVTTVMNYTKAGDFLEQTTHSSDQSYVGTFLGLRF
jgi:hypothetical protein